MRFRPDADTSTSRQIGISNPFLSKDNTTCRKIGAGDDIKQSLRVRLFVIDQKQQPVDQLIESVRGNIGRHTDSDTA
ncbi:hypothetical protein D1872_317600 [compost metagenome]